MRSSPSNGLAMTHVVDVDADGGRADEGIREPADRDERAVPVAALVDDQARDVGAERAGVVDAGGLELLGKDGRDARRLALGRGFRAWGGDDDGFERLRAVGGERGKRQERAERRGGENRRGAPIAGRATRAREARGAASVLTRRCGQMITTARNAKAHLSEFLERGHEEEICPLPESRGRGCPTHHVWMSMIARSATSTRTGRSSRWRARRSPATTSR